MISRIAAVTEMNMTISNLLFWEFGIGWRRNPYQFIRLKHREHTQKAKWELLSHIPQFSMVRKNQEVSQNVDLIRCKTIIYVSFIMSFLLNNYPNLL